MAMRVRKILFPTDFSSCADQALSHAIFLADKYVGALHLLHVMVLHEDDPHNPAHHFPNIAEIASRLKEKAAFEMTADIEALKATTLDVKKVQLRGIAAAPVILDYAKENDIDLIVMGTHGRRGLRYLLLGSVADEVVRMAPCPVLTIRQRDSRQVDAVKQILVPIDFSNFARQAFSYAVDVASLYGADLQLLHVIEEAIHPAFYVTGKDSVFDFMPDLRSRSKQGLEQILREHGGEGSRASVHLREGRAAQEIVQFATQNHSDLIVIATHGLTGFKHLLLGSVTEKVVSMAPCPVLTVKAFGKSLV